MKKTDNRFLAYTCLSALALLFGMISFRGVQAQRPVTIGEWKAYVSHNNPNQIVKFRDKFAAVTVGGLFTFDTLGVDMKGYTKVEGLSGSNPEALHYDPVSDYLFIGYIDGRVDYTRDPENGFKYITDIYRTDLFTTKTINRFQSDSNGLLYIATGFGIVIYDVEKGETRKATTKIGTNPSGSPVNDILIFQDTLYAAMNSKGLWKAPLNHQNITLPDAWTKVSGQNGLPTGNTYEVTYGGGYLYAAVNDSIFRKWYRSTNWTRTSFPFTDYRAIEGNDGYLIMCYGNLLRYRDSLAVQKLVTTSSLLTCAYMDSTILICGDTLEGVYRHLEPDSGRYFIPEGPRNNKISQLAVGNGTLVIAPEGKAGQSASAETRNGFYTHNNTDGWRIYRTQTGLDPTVSKDFARVLYVPTTNQFFLGSWNHGILELTDGNVTHLWTPVNSNLSGSGNVNQPNNIRVSGLAYDRNGVLWATAMLADKNLNALDPTDSTWIQFHIPGCYPTGIVVDDFNQKWIIDQDQGLAVFSDNGTLDNPNDDQIKRLTAVNGQGGLPNNSVYDIVKDHRGHIWVGTIQGIAVFANPGAVFSNNFSDASCPVIEGFCLLRDQRVTAIAVDGSNRKWIGTTNGVYLVNPQGNKLITHYTVDNSPLFDNEIRDIAIDPETGEIFIGTARGLISLMGDATEGEETSDSLYVFPNPILPDYDGPIAINGSVKDAEVRITTVSGRLVRALTATGGQTVWDGHDTAGNPLAPGIYLAMVASKEGKGGGIAKFVVLSRQE